MSAPVGPCRFCGEACYSRDTGQFRCGSACYGLAGGVEAARGHECMRREIVKLRLESSRLRDLASTLSDQADRADRYERWLLDIGRAVGCQHLDENLVNCVVSELQGDSR